MLNLKVVHRALIVLLLASVPVAGQEEVLTNEDIIALTANGIPASVILTKMESSASDFDSSVEAILALGKAGVDPEIIEAMTATAARVQVEENVAVEAGAHLPQGGPCMEPGVFLVLENGTLRALELTQPVSTKRGRFTDALKPIPTLKARSQLPGARSPVRTTERTPSFYFCFERAPGGLALETDQPIYPNQFPLVEMESMKRKDRRSMVVGKANLFSSSDGVPAGKRRKTESTELAPSVFEVLPLKPLKPGEYGFFYAPTERVYAFGVDK